MEYYKDKQCTLIVSDCLEAMKVMPNGSVDSIVTDPPYGLEFMGKDWDAPWKSDRRQTFDGTLTDVRDNAYGRSKVRYGHGASYGTGNEHMQAFQAWATPIFVEAMRVLKPGGHLLSFGGSRTYHRIACAIEDAGFEVRDQIMWVYGSGFPKSKNLDGEWQGWGTALKPAHEPICVARKPLAKGNTVAKNVLEFGTGAININTSRVPINPLADASQMRTMQRSVREADGWGMSTVAGDTPQVVRADGRWPANLIHDGSDEVLECFPDAKGQQGSITGKEPSAKTSDIFGEFAARSTAEPRIELGKSAARFFYCAKASKKDKGVDNKHPTVKPTDLMRYLVRLVTPPGGTVFDMFMGSGSTGKAAKLEGFKFIGIDQDASYVETAKLRILAAYPHCGR